jgi:PiT family inorganic phosphate transporter
MIYYLDRENAMEPTTIIILGLALLVCAYMAWNIGANDVANAMGTSVGSRALTLKQAVIIAAIFEFCGAFFAGDAVTDTIRKGILNVDFEKVSSQFSRDLAFGFIAAMMAAATWLTVATRLGLPVSTTHSIIGGIIGIGLILEVKYEMDDLINWGVVLKVVISWVVSPLVGGLLAFFSYYIIKRTIMDAENPEEKAIIIAPILAFPTFFVLGLALQFKALKGFFSNLESEGYIASKYDWLPVNEGGVWNPMADNAWFPLNSLIVATVIGTLASLVLYNVLIRVDINDEKRGFKGVERIFVWLQIITAAYVAFAHGANDLSNAIGPMAAVWQILGGGGEILEKTSIPVWILLLGSLGIAIGVMTWGWRVMETIGTKITEITPTRGFAAEFGAATTILMFSMPFLAVPVSTTHTLVGAVVGVGLAGGAKAVDFRVFGKIVASWIASVPIAAFGAVVLFVASGGDDLNMIVILPIAFLTIGYVMWKNIRDEPVKEVVHDSTLIDDAVAHTPFELFHEHAKSVEITVEKMLEAVNKASERKDASAEIKATIEAELAADVLKNDLRSKMVALEFRLMVNRDEFLHMLSRQDRIADYAQNVAEQLSFRELYDNDEALVNLKKMGEAVAITVAAYEDAVETLKDMSLSGMTKVAKERLESLIDAVNLREHEADEVESRAAAHVFSSGDEDALAAMHMYRVLQRLDDVANSCEKAANAFLPILHR